jgi:DNA polymerase-3 subunit epsilon
MSWWEFWKPKQERLDFIQEFLDANSQPIPGIRSLDRLTFSVLDTETTGLDPAKDSMLSFGAIQVSGLKIQVQTAVEWYPKSENTDRKSARIHGLVDIPHSISREEFSKRLLKYLGNSILVGHHLGFDLEMLGRTLAPFGLARFPNPVIDTLNLAVRLEHGPLADFTRINRDLYSLDELCKRYGIEPEDRHTAAGDAFLTAQLFLKLLKNCSHKGIVNFKDLIKIY